MKTVDFFVLKFTRGLRQVTRIAFIDITFYFTINMTIKQMQEEKLQYYKNSFFFKAASSF
jgi:hypothetical protein